MLLRVLLFSLAMPRPAISQPHQRLALLGWLSGAQPAGLGLLPATLAADELPAAGVGERLSGREQAIRRVVQQRPGSWWAWLSIAALGAALLRVALALRAARRFNRELAIQVGYLVCHLPPASALPPARPVARASLPVALTPPPVAPTPEPPPKPAAPPHQQQALSELRQAAEAALADADFGPTQLAEQLALGERTLYRYVKELTGLTPAAYLRELRLQQAHHLLETRSCATVAEAAYQSGFNDPSHFGQVFYKRFGKKPSAYLQAG